MNNIHSLNILFLFYICKQINYTEKKEEYQIVITYAATLTADALIGKDEYPTPPEPLCPVLRATHSVERAIFLFL